MRRTLIMFVPMVALVATAAVAAAACPLPPSDIRANANSRAGWEAWVAWCQGRGGKVRTVNGLQGCHDCPATASATGSQLSETWDAGLAVRRLGRLFTDPFGARARSTAARTRPTPAETRATTLNEAGIRAWNARDYATARDKFAAALHEDPNDQMIRRNLAMAWRALAWQHRETMAWQAALDALRQAATIDPTLTDLRQGLEELEREQASQLAAARLRDAERQAADAERERLRVAAARAADSLRRAGGAATDMKFMDVTPVDANVVDLRGLDGRRLVVDPRVLSNTPTVQREQAALQNNPESWYAAAQQRSREAAAINRAWSSVVMRAIREGESSNTFRYAHWVTFPADDPELDAALLRAVRAAHPELDPQADPRLLRAIAQSHITEFLAQEPAAAARPTPQQERLDEIRRNVRQINAEAERLAVIRSNAEEILRAPAPRPPADRAVHTWAADNLLEILERPPQRRTVADEALSAAIVERIAAEEAQSRSAAFTPLGELSPGDVVVVAPPAARLDPVGAAAGAAIQAGDYLTRVATDFANRGLAGALATEVQPASHTVTFVGARDGQMLFLEHTPGSASRIVDSREVLVRYGSREMFVARPLPPVNGRELWNAAQQSTGYGVCGARVVCSEKAGLAVARATGQQLTNGRLGPFDITPGDFLDPANEVGKHFVVTRLRITGVPRRP